MEKRSVQAFVAILLLLLGTGIVVGAITGTRHDFSTAVWNPGGQLCEPCHAPHTQPPLGQTPLWNHAQTTNAGSFTVYASGTMNATVGQPTGISILCLGCHDGSVALEDFGGASGGTYFISAAYQVGGGGDLTGSHPVSFTYDSALATADGELFDPATTASGVPNSTGTIAQDMLFGTANDQLECASCHDVHGRLDAGGNLISKLLIKWNTASALCLTCHNK